MTAPLHAFAAPQSAPEEQPITGVYPLHAGNFSSFMDWKCGGPVRYGPPAPKRSYDWSVSKEENLRRVAAEIDAAFARGVR